LLLIPRYVEFNIAFQGFARQIKSQTSTDQVIMTKEYSKLIDNPEVQNLDWALKAGTWHPNQEIDKERIEASRQRHESRLKFRDLLTQGLGREEYAFFHETCIKANYELQGISELPSILRTAAQHVVHYYLSSIVDVALWPDKEVLLEAKEEVSFRALTMEAWDKAKSSVNLEKTKTQEEKTDTC